MFGKRNKKPEGQAEAVAVPGWQGPWHSVAACLRKGGGRPENWEAEGVGTTPGSLLSTLEKIPVPSRNPLPGIQRRMWACAAACKQQSDRRQKLEAEIATLKHEQGLSSGDASVLRQEIIKLKAEIAALTELAGRAITHLSSSKRKSERKRPRSVNPTQIRAFVTQLNNGDGWDIDHWDGNIWGDSDDQYEDELPPQVRANPVVRRKQVQRRPPVRFEVPDHVMVSHYIDDIMIQGSGQAQIQTLLDALVQHMKGYGWEINPAKIQGPSQTVKFLGIIWNKGEREVTEKARDKIQAFAVPHTQKDVQQFIGLFGFWRQHIPHLGQILRPLYQITRKKAEFEWTNNHQLAFEMAKQAIQQAVSLGKIQSGPVELQVSAQGDYANWSLWQKQGRVRKPLGFWSRKLPPAGGRYTPFEKQLLSCYWSLVETEALTAGHEVIMRTAIPILPWVMSDPTTHRIGTAQESSIIKWKWYVSERVKTGQKGVSVLHEQVAEAPEGGEVRFEVIEYTESPVKLGKRYDELTSEEQATAWFVDGSAQWKSGRRRWKAAAYNPKQGITLEELGEGKSSQWAELKAVHMVIMQAGIIGVHLFSDSWSVVNGMTQWMPTWQANQWMIQSWEVWGRPLWEEIWEKAQHLRIFITHVDAHTSRNDAEALHNRYVDGIVRAMVIQRDTSVDLARWAHQKAGHWGVQGTLQWARDRGIDLLVDDVKTAVNQCEQCQHQRQGVPQHMMGHIHRGDNSGPGLRTDHSHPGEYVFRRTVS
ncbi:uncharacterized protein LOC121275130 [Carcharodon carcharias]|uniref:uncharacterized protein LOC121275130 n=1 Tax=Carcharodon carcharias TaxID=13397 RepID=UPI001B7F57E6|nr:uncharacterized protein LOC121275130 [Carcharodon carcharias]